MQTGRERFLNCGLTGWMVSLQQFHSAPLDSQTHSCCYVDIFWAMTVCSITVWFGWNLSTACMMTCFTAVVRGVMLQTCLQRIASDDKPDPLNKVQEEVDELKGIMVRNIGKSLRLTALSPSSQFTHTTKQTYLPYAVVLSSTMPNTCNIFCRLKPKNRKIC